VLYAMQTAVGDELSSLLSQPSTDVSLARALQLVRGSDGLARAATLAFEYADRAEAAMVPLRGSAAGDALALAGRELVESVRSSTQG
jgi:geranylgeranyl pyrophosphate synthase